MTGRETGLERMELTVRGIGGIDSTTVTLGRGVNILEGRNATNRTSLLQAIMAGLGSTNVSLKGDHDEGEVELVIDGVTYEDSVAHLSESEREVVGIVFALAGYLVHEVYDTVPIMLLDSLEAIDSERIALLVDYLDDFSPTIVAALLPGDGAALDDSYNRVEDI